MYSMNPEPKYVVTKQESETIDRLFIETRVSLASLAEMLRGISMYAMEGDYVDARRLLDNLGELKKQWEDAKKTGQVET